jgi:hypothetical protein
MRAVAVVEVAPGAVRPGHLGRQLQRIAGVAEDLLPDQHRGIFAGDVHRGDESTGLLPAPSRLDDLEQQRVRRPQRRERAAMAFVGGLRHPAQQRPLSQVRRDDVGIGVAEVFGVQFKQPLPEPAERLDLAGLDLGQPVSARRNQRGDVAERIPIGECDEDCVNRLHAAQLRTNEPK